MAQTRRVHCILLLFIGFVSVQGLCPDSWCLNGGTCFDDPAAICHCPDGFAGFYCEITITGEEECEDSKCLNGGGCEPDYVPCYCPVGFTGYFCETAVCEVDTDCNGGECLNYSMSSVEEEFVCVDCPDGYGGPRCQTPWGNFCRTTDGICLNGGTCMPRVGQPDFYCVCPDNYLGPLCQIHDVCSGINPCHNGGTCVDGGCECEGPFVGDLCEKSCARDDDCMNGGICNGAGECECTDGFEGPRCGQELCTRDSDCLNGGSCNQDGACDCVANHEGQRCEIACRTDSQCQNGGHCETSGVCECVNGFMGSRCQDSPENNVTIIIVAAVAAVVILLLLIVILLLLIRRRRAMKRLRRTAKNEELELGGRNQRQSNSYVDVNDRDKPKVARRPDELNYEPGSKPQEFPRELLHVMEQLGAGSFATVHRAEADGIVKKGTMTTVAIKMLKPTASEGDKSDFEKERSMYLTLGNHPNVVKMLGFCTEKEPFYLIMEYLPNGNLQTYLRHIRTGSKEQYFHLKEIREETRNYLLPSEILSFAIQIASGMEFLASKSCIHRDLATRNILLGDDLVAKVSDFGLARDIQDSKQYEMKSHGRVPVRWMAPESLLDNIYTSKSDVWGFAVLLWELVTLGSHPYPGMSSKEVMDKITTGYRLPKPESCSDEVYDMMTRCWNKNPVDRPTFTEICKLLDIMMADASGYLVMSDLNKDDYLYLEPNQMTKSVHTAEEY